MGLDAIWDWATIVVGVQGTAGLSFVEVDTVIETAVGGLYLLNF